MMIGAKKLPSGEFALVVGVTDADIKKVRNAGDVVAESSQGRAELVYRQDDSSLAHLFRLMEGGDDLSYRASSAKLDWDSPVNPVAGLAHLTIEAITVAEYHPSNDGSGRPTSVDLILQVRQIPEPLIMAFKSARGINNFIATLESHRKSVFGE